MKTEVGHIRNFVTRYGGWIKKEQVSFVPSAASIVCNWQQAGNFVEVAQKFRSTPLSLIRVTKQAKGQEWTLEAKEHCLWFIAFI